MRLTQSQDVINNKDVDGQKLTDEIPSILDGKFNSYDVSPDVVDVTFVNNNKNNQDIEDLKEEKEEFKEEEDQQSNNDRNLVYEDEVEEDESDVFDDLRDEAMDDATYTKMMKYVEDGKNYFNSEKFAHAHDCFKSAIKLLPEPIEQWDAGIWLLTAMGDTNFQLRDYENALKYISDAMSCPTGRDTPFLYLRLGQIFFEMNLLDSALEDLEVAFVNEGEDIFRNEHPKYLQFLFDHKPDLKP
eukprot:gene4006-5009_t